MVPQRKQKGSFILYVHFRRESSSLLLLFSSSFSYLLAPASINNRETIRPDHENQIIKIMMQCENGVAHPDTGCLHLRRRMRVRANGWVVQIRRVWLCVFLGSVKVGQTFKNRPNSSTRSETRPPQTNGSLELGRGGGSSFLYHLTKCYEDGRGGWKSTILTNVFFEWAFYYNCAVMNAKAKFNLHES